MKKTNRQKNYHQKWTATVALLLILLGFSLLGWKFLATVKANLGEHEEYPVSTSTSRKVLYLSSYDAAYETFEDNVNAIRQVLNENNITFDVLCLDAKAYYNSRNLNDFYNLIRDRIDAGASYEGVIVSDDVALSFALAYRDDLFPGLPITYFGVNGSTLARTASKDPLIAGYMEDDCIGETLDLAKKLIPDADRVLAVYDATPTGLGAYETYEDLAGDYPSLTFDAVNFTDYTEENLQSAFEDVDEKTIVMVLSASHDADGHYYLINQSASVISDLVPVPVFHNSAGGFHTGYTAGAYMDFRQMAALAASQLVSAMNGEESFKTLRAPLTVSDMTLYTYNYEKVKEFHLKQSVFPRDSIVVNPPKTFWTTYRPVLVPLVLISAGMFLLLVDLRYSYQESRKREQKLAEAVQESKASRDELQWRDEHDYLTGLMNWRTALLRLDSFSASNEAPYAVILVDIDNFKSVNETYGHRNGDMVLKTVTERLQKMTEEENIFLSRYGGDEFLMLVRGEYLDENSRVLEKVLDVFRKPIQIGDESFVPYSSIGVANSNGRKNTEDVVLSADMALNFAKHKGKNLVKFYTDDMKKKVSSEVSVKTALIGAIEKDGFSMVYQPQVDCATGETTGFESLVRMPSSGISPGIFIPVAESCGLIRQIGRITTEKTIRQIAAWRDAGAKLYPVSINSSSTTKLSIRAALICCSVRIRLHAPMLWSMLIF